MPAKKEPQLEEREVIEILVEQWGTQMSGAFSEVENRTEGQIGLAAVTIIFRDDPCHCGAHHPITHFQVKGGDKLSKRNFAKLLHDVIQYYVDDEHNDNIMEHPIGPRH